MENARSGGQAGRSAGARWLAFRACPRGPWPPGRGAFQSENPHRPRPPVGNVSTRRPPAGRYAAPAGGGNGTAPQSASLAAGFEAAPKVDGLGRAADRQRHLGRRPSSRWRLTPRRREPAPCPERMALEAARRTGAAWSWDNGALPPKPPRRSDSRGEPRLG